MQINMEQSQQDYENKRKHNLKVLHARNALHLKAIDAKSRMTSEYIYIHHFVRTLDKRNTVYVEGKPLKQVSRVKLPLRFTYGSYNEPYLIANCGIYVNDVIAMSLNPHDLT